MSNVIAIDGPSGAGKSSVSRLVGERLGYLHVDSGALYRIITWQCLEHGVNVDDPAAIAAFADKVAIECRSEEGRIAYFVGGERPGERIRTIEINANASKVAREKPVRDRVTALLRDMVSFGNLVVEGPMPSDPVNPWYDTVTNLTIKVKMSITNEQTAVAHSPYMLRGLQPGSDSYHYVDNGSVLWTSVTFKVTGDIQNGMENRTRWVPLRYFVFNAGSFDEDHTATIDIWDPFDPYGSPATKGWSNFTNCPVFYSWAIDERLAPSAIEPLKADSTYRGE